MRVLTFQNPVVIDILLKDGIYYSDSLKCREKRDYCLDIEQLGGYNPIWVFTNPVDNDMLSKGALIDTFRCEMSLSQKNTFHNMLMIELEIPDDLPKVGLTHNAYGYAEVIPYIQLENLRATYKVNDTGHFFYKEIELVNLYNGNTEPLVNGRLNTRDLAYSLYLFEDDDGNEEKDCFVCDGKTRHNEIVSGIKIPICSKKCNRLIYNEEYYINKLNNLKDFRNEMSFNK